MPLMRWAAALRIDLKLKVLEEERSMGSIRLHIKICIDI